MAGQRPDEMWYNIRQRSSRCRWRTRPKTLADVARWYENEILKMRTTSEWKDAHTRVFTMYSPAGQGEEFAMMKITYKRRSHKAASPATN